MTGTPLTCLCSIRAMGSKPWELLGLSPIACSSIMSQLPSQSSNPWSPLAWISKSKSALAIAPAASTANTRTSSAPTSISHRASSPDPPVAAIQSQSLAIGSTLSILRRVFSKSEWNEKQQSCTIVSNLIVNQGNKSSSSRHM